MSAYQTQIRAGCFPIRLKPVTQIVLPCLPQGDIRGTGKAASPIAELVLASFTRRALISDASAAENPSLAHPTSLRTRLPVVSR